MIEAVYSTYKFAQERYKETNSGKDWYRVITNLKFAIEQEIYKTPGMYPVEFEADRITLGCINMGFDYKIEDEAFRVRGQFRPNQGLYVVKSEVETQTLETGFQGVIGQVIHLPEGWTFPIGPLYFGETEPPTQQDVAQYIEKKRKGSFLGLGRVKELSEREIESLARYVYRYFNWQPQLPETPKFIWWDISQSDVEGLGTSPEQGPLITKTATWSKWNPRY